MFFILCEVNYLPKLNTATNTDFINLSIILFYIFASNKYGYAVYLLNQQLPNQLKNRMQYNLVLLLSFHLL